MSLSDLYGRAGRSFLSGLELPAARRFALDGYLRILDALEREIKSTEERVGQEHENSQEARLFPPYPG